MENIFAYASLIPCKSQVTQQASADGWGPQLTGPLAGRGKAILSFPAPFSVSAVTRWKDFVVSTVSTLMGYMRSETLKSPSRSQTERQGDRAAGDRLEQADGVYTQDLHMPCATTTLSGPWFLETGVILLTSQVCKIKGVLCTISYTCPGRAFSK